MRIDFHVHTEYSKDGCIKLDDIEKILKENKIIDAIAITDHNEIEAGLKLKKDFKDKIIIGEEIDTGEGEIIGYWLKENIPPLQGIVKTLDDIKNQDGFICIPHPFDQMRSKRIDMVKLEQFINKVNIIEVFNSRNLFNNANENARQFAAKHGLIATAGSDAHYKGEIGNAWVDCKALNSVDDSAKVCQAIREGVIKGKRCNISCHIKTKILKLSRTNKLNKDEIV